MIKKGFAAILLIAFHLPLLNAYNKELVILSHKTYTFENPGCTGGSTCSLKRVDYTVEDYKVGIGDSYNYGTRLFARYETDSPATLEDYLFVQFVKGSIYSSELRDGAVVKHYDVARKFFGRVVRFDFRKWVIDSDVADPAFSRTPWERSRYYLCRWNLIPGSFSPATEKLYGLERPTSYSELYVVDHPGTAFVMDGIARNVALKFKTCIYDAKDVPTKTRPRNLKFAKPINCFRWDSSFIYDFARGEYKNRSVYLASCSQPPGGPEKPSAQTGLETPTASFQQ